jgi:hypothetical protein
MSLSKTSASRLERLTDEQIAKRYIKEDCSILRLSKVLDINYRKLRPRLKAIDIWSYILEHIQKVSGLNGSVADRKKFCKDLSWEVPTIMKKLGFSQAFGARYVIEIFTKIGVIKAFKDELKRVHCANGLSISKTAMHFSSKEVIVSGATVTRWLKELKLEEETTQIVENEQSELTEERIQQIFEEHGPKIKSIGAALKPYGNTRDSDVISFLISIGKTVSIKSLLKKLFLEDGMSKIEVAERFGVWRHTIARWLVNLGIDEEINKGGSIRANTTAIKINGVSYTLAGEYFMRLKKAGFDGLKEIKVKVSDKRIKFIALLKGKGKKDKQFYLGALRLNRQGLPIGIKFGKRAGKKVKNKVISLREALAEQGNPEELLVTTIKFRQKVGHPVVYFRACPVRIDSFLLKRNLKPSQVRAIAYRGTAKNRRIEIRKRVKGKMDFNSGELITTIKLDKEGNPIIMEERILTVDQKAFLLKGVTYSGVVAYKNYLKYSGMGEFKLLKLKETEDTIEIFGIISEKKGISEKHLHSIRVDKDTRVPVGIKLAKNKAVSLVKVLIKQGEIVKRVRKKTVRKRVKKTKRKKTKKKKVKKKKKKSAKKKTAKKKVAKKKAAKKKVAKKKAAQKQKVLPVCSDAKLKKIIEQVERAVICRIGEIHTRIDEANGQGLSKQELDRIKRDLLEYLNEQFKLVPERHNGNRVYIMYKLREIRTIVADFINDLENLYMMDSDDIVWVAGMIPAISWGLVKMGISLDHQAWIEQVIFWGALLFLVPAFGKWALLIWAVFFFAHFRRFYHWFY